MTAIELLTGNRKRLKLPERLKLDLVKAEMLSGIEKSMEEPDLRTKEEKEFHRDATEFVLPKLPRKVMSKMSEDRSDEVTVTLEDPVPGKFAQRTLLGKRERIGKLKRAENSERPLKVTAKDRPVEIPAASFKTKELEETHSVEAAELIPKTQRREES